jgi:hypothetical protein
MSKENKFFYWPNAEFIDGPPDDYLWKTRLQDLFGRIGNAMIDGLWNRIIKPSEPQTHVVLPELEPALDNQAN